MSFTSNCPLCGRERTYTNKGNMMQGLEKPCRSCANSISSGGQGWSPYCIDCKVNLRDEKYNSHCKECHNARSKKHYKKIGRWAKYGLSGPIEMNECEICSSKNDLVIDHCHDSGKVRGVLCRTCNLGIGSLKENKELIRRALEYAERTFS